MKLFKGAFVILPMLVLTMACGLIQPNPKPAFTATPIPVLQTPPTPQTTPLQATPLPTPTLQIPTSPVPEIEHPVKVLPVFFVPAGEKSPTPDQDQKLLRHLKWAQQRYLEMLAGQDTFQLAAEQAAIYMAKNPLSFYRAAPEGGAPQYLSELLDYFKTNRFETPSIYLIIVMNPHDDYPGGGGRPINGGYNTGGGIIILSSYALDNIPNLQSTLQHELGHSFGLPHVDVYGYNMDNNPSIMSYNLAQHTRDFNAAPTPGVLIPEDLRGLALNRQVFPQLLFNEAQDVPQGYKLNKNIVCLGPMDIPGQPAWFAKVTTSSGEDYGSSINNALQHEIKPSTAKAGFDPATMWHSKKTSTGWVSLEITFPMEVTLDKIAVHSQHSGQYHAARQIKIQPFKQGSYQNGTQKSLTSVDALVSFSPLTAQKWKLSFEAGESAYVVIRGLQFYNAGKEIFPPPIPSKH